MILNKKSESIDLKRCDIAMGLNVKTKKMISVKYKNHLFFLKNIFYKKVFKISNFPSTTTSNFGGIYHVSPFFIG